jgi:hypothetical protein
MVVGSVCFAQYYTCRGKRPHHTVGWISSQGVMRGQQHFMTLGEAEGGGGAGRGNNYVIHAATPPLHTHTQKHTHRHTQAHTHRGSSMVLTSNLPYWDIQVLQ